MSIATRLLLIVALAVLPALLVGAYAEYAARQEREAEVREEAVRLANQVADEIGQIIEGVQRVAITLSHIPVVRAAATGGGAESCSRLIAELGQEFPGGLGIGIANASGELVCAGQSVPPGLRVEGGHLEAALQQDGFVVGGYGLAPNGATFLSFAYPLRDWSGQQVGAVVLGLRLNWLEERLRQRYIDRDSSISIVDRNFVYLLRLPEDPQRSVGREAIPEHRALAALAGQGALEARGADGVVRVGAIVPLALDAQSPQDFDLLVGFGVSKEAAFGPIEAATRNALLLLAACLLLALAAAWLGGRYLIRRPVAQLLEAADKWREGDYTARVSAADARGEFGALTTAFNGMAQNIAEREKALQESEERFRTLAGLVPTFVWFSDPSGRLLYANERWYDFTGQSPVEGAPAHWADAIHRDEAEATLTRWGAAVAKGESFEAQFRVRRRDGAYHWVLGRAEPLRDAAGAITSWFGATTDIDGLKRADEHRSLLVDELNHRVKNTLVTVQSLAAQSLRDPDPQQARKAFEGRLIALSRAHDVLTKGYWKTASLRQVVDEAVEAFDHDETRRIEREGPDVELEPRVALALSMALHELLTNAVKYGALNSEGGRIAIRWRLDGQSGGEKLALHWRESGGPPVILPERRGFGTRLIENGLPREFGGAVELEFAPEGLTCSFSLALAPGEADHATTESGRAQATGKSAKPNADAE